MMPLSATWWCVRSAIFHPGPAAYRSTDVERMDSIRLFVRVTVSPAAGTSFIDDPSGERAGASLARWYGSEAAQPIRRHMDEPPV